MLQSPIPVRRWKQWLALPLVAGLFFGASPAASAQTAPAADQAARKAASKKELLEAWRQDSLAGGQSKPGVLTIRRNEAGKLTITHELNAPPAPVPRGQGAPATSDKVYTYVEQMPALPGKPGMAAIVEQIQSNLVYPAGAQVEGRVFASFTVGAAGDVRDIRIVKGLADVYDSAVAEAILALPRFEPGKQNGRAVAVSFTVPVTFKNKP